MGKRIAAKAKDAGITKVVFDRAGYKYHGRVKAVADGAREGGLGVLKWKKLENSEERPAHLRRRG